VTVIKYSRYINSELADLFNVTAADGPDELDMYLNNLETTVDVLEFWRGAKFYLGVVLQEMGKNCVDGWRTF